MKLLEALKYWTAIQPEKVLHTFLDDYGDEVERLTYSDLDRRSSALANHLLLLPCTSSGGGGASSSFCGGGSDDDISAGGDACGEMNDSGGVGPTAAGLVPPPKKKGGCKRFQKGSRVVLVFPPCLDFIVAFYACLKAGLIAVPVFPPDPRGGGGGGRKAKDVAMFATIVHQSGASGALTNRNYDLAKKLGGLRDLFSGGGSGGVGGVGGGGVGGCGSSSGDGVKPPAAAPATTKQTSGSGWPDHLAWVVMDSLDLNLPSLPSPALLTAAATAAAAVNDAAVNGAAATDDDGDNDGDDTPAFLQFTSGSTSEPKGVVITHGNLAHNLSLITHGLSADQSTVVCSWLPLYHDMGLIGSYLGALYCGGCGVYFSPVSFIRDPPMWVRAMSSYRATHMQAPNFAYGLVARKFLAETKGTSKNRLRFHKTKNQNSSQFLDLSCVQHMINAAEPVRVGDMEVFYSVFESFGLKRGTVYPTYGLAEHTVFVCTNGSLVLEVDRQSLEDRGGQGRTLVKVLHETRNSCTPSSRGGTSTNPTSLQAHESDNGGQGGGGSGGDAPAAAAAAAAAAAVDTSTPAFAQAAAAASAVTVCGCGYPGQARGVDLVIVKQKKNEEGEEGGGVEVVGELEVGEIWVRSKSRALGYWNDPLKTAGDFGGLVDKADDDENIADDIAHDDTADSKADDKGGVQEEPIGGGGGGGFQACRGYLKTGDLGFLYKEELFVCGRLKDLIITRGANVFPQDVERAAEDASGGLLRGGCSAAFACPFPPHLKRRHQRRSRQQRKHKIQSRHSSSSSSSSGSNTGSDAGGGGNGNGDDEEAAVFLVAEVSEKALAGVNADGADADFNALIHTLRTAVSQATGASLHGVCLLRPRSVPKTTSGKIARNWCRYALLQGSLEVVHEWFDFSDVLGSSGGGNANSGRDSFRPTSLPALPTLQNPFQKEDQGAASAQETGDGGRGAGGGGDNAVGDNGEEEEEEEEEVFLLKVVVDAVAVSVLRCDPSLVDADAPVPSLGLGSMEGVQVLALIEKRLGVALPGEIMFEEDTTLRSLVPLIQQGRKGRGVRGAEAGEGGGVVVGVGERVCLVDGARVSASCGLPGQKEEERLAQVLKATTKASWRDGSFPLGSLSKPCRLYHQFLGDQLGGGGQSPPLSPSSPLSPPFSQSTKKKKKTGAKSGVDDEDDDLELTATELAAAAFVDVAVASSLFKAGAAAAVSVVGLGLRMALVVLATFPKGGDSSRGVGSGSGSIIDFWRFGGWRFFSGWWGWGLSKWAVCVIASLLWVCACLKASSRHRKRAALAVDASGALPPPSSLTSTSGKAAPLKSGSSATSKSIHGADSARARILNGLGCKILYEAPLDPLDGPFFVAAFRPSAPLARAAPSPAKVRSQLLLEATSSPAGGTGEGPNGLPRLSFAARRSKVERAVATAQANRETMRSGATLAVAEAVDETYGGLPLTRKPPTYHGGRQATRIVERLGLGREGWGSGDNEANDSSSSDDGDGDDSDEEAEKEKEEGRGGGGGGHPLLPMVEVMPTMRAGDGRGGGAATVSTGGGCLLALLAAASVHRAVFGTDLDLDTEEEEEEEEEEERARKENEKQKNSSEGGSTCRSGDGGGEGGKGKKEDGEGGEGQEDGGYRRRSSCPVAVLQGRLDFENFQKEAAASAQLMSHTNNPNPSTTVAARTSKAAPSSSPSSLVFGALGSPLGLRYFGHGDSEGAGAPQVGLQGAAAAVRAMREGGTVFYAPQSSGQSKPQTLQGAAVGAAAAVEVAEAVADVVVCCMRHGAALVPCLTLGDRAAEAALLGPSSLVARVVSSSTSTSTTQSLLGLLLLLPLYWFLALLSLAAYSAWLPALVSAQAKPWLLKFACGAKGEKGSGGENGGGVGGGGGASLQSVSLAVVYGTPIALPHTSAPHPKVVAECTKTVLAALQRLEEKYAALHCDH